MKLFMQLRCTLTEEKYVAECRVEQYCVDADEQPTNK
jgi:hypothetical protein